MTPAFSQDLKDLAEQFPERSVKLAELLCRTQGRGINLLLVTAGLPFVTPIPVPGLSIPFAVIAIIAGARMALGRRHPWLPKKLLARELPPRFLHKLLNMSSRVVKYLECFLRPRLGLFNDHPAFRRLAGILITLCGLLLLLPLPVPFSNGLPALTILLLSAGALERDGLAFLIGSAVFLLTAGFFVFLVLGGLEASQHLFTN